MQVPTAAIFTTTAKRLATGNGKNPKQKSQQKKKKRGEKNRIDGPRQAWLSHKAGWLKNRDI